MKKGILPLVTAEMGLEGIRQPDRERHIPYDTTYIYKI